MLSKKILDFYKQTSPYTDLGLYSDFAKRLPDDLGRLCTLQRSQIIHPFHLVEEKLRQPDNPFYGDLSQVPATSLPFENDLFPTAQSMLAELLRRDPHYSSSRKTADKIHVCCREQAILLASILKAKGIAARARSGFRRHFGSDGSRTFGDHWMTEYYNEDKSRWALVDVDHYFPQEVLVAQGIDFDLLDFPRGRFLFGAEAYLGLRNGAFKPEETYWASDPPTFGLKAAIRVLFYDFHCLMNDELIFALVPKYLVDQDFQLSDAEHAELDQLAEAMLDPDHNFDTIQKIWNENGKFRIMSGGLNS